jgi:hypothetical protein
MNRLLLIIGILSLLCLSLPLKADVAPPSPDIARHPELPKNRQPAFGFTIATGCVLTALILGSSILARMMRLPGPLGAIAGITTVVVWIVAGWFVYSQWLRASRELEELTIRADREWAEWDEKRRNYRHHEKPRPDVPPPAPVLEPQQPTPASLE